MHEQIPIRCLIPGQTAEVSQVLGDPLQVHRLHELGLRCGAVVEMIRSGSPCVVRLAGQKLCFRQNPGLDVLVRPATAV